jgi:CheY-like chemotaxis protein
MKTTSTILIVDDEPVGQKALEGLLLPLEYNLAFAGNGLEALTKAAALIPDLILLDVMMPAMNGFETCRRLRAHPFLADVPIIMVTALDDHDSRLQGLEAGADDFLAKPFDRVALRARVKTIVRLNRYRRLLLERARFEWVVEQADDGYLLIGDSDAVLYANSKACLYLGLVDDKRKPVAKNFLEMARKQYRFEPQRAWTDWPYLPDGELPSPRYLVRPESPTANAFWLQVDVLNIPTGPEANRLIRLRDVTAQKAMQRDVWQFHAMISHKLSTPMMGMLYGLELLARHITNLSRAEITEISKVAFETTQRFHEAVQDILQYLNAPTLARHGTGFKFSQLRPIVIEIAAALGLKSVTMSYQNELDNIRVLFSKRAIELVLQEILENAKKFHPRHAPHVKVAVSLASDQQVIIKISDDGLRLAPQQLAQLQTPYYQAEKQMTGQVAGMGLGLSMVASLMWEVGGNCRIYNREPGPGLVVELLLPLAVSEESEATDRELNLNYAFSEAEEVAVS